MEIYLFELQKGIKIAFQTARGTILGVACDKEVWKKVVWEEEMARIGLIDVDGHNFPNLPLMKISSWHKAKKDIVEWYSWVNHYDKVYMSKVFTFSDDYNYYINANEVIKGGTGYGLDNSLPEEIEHSFPDYSLYGITDTAYGFLTRGCPRGCDFCIVGQKEGLCSRKVANLSEFWNGQKYIKLLDPNLLACKERMDLLQQLIESKAWIDFTQGLDVRLVNKEICQWLSDKMKIKMIHFAWDNYEFKTYEHLLRYRSMLEFDERKLRVYVLTNFNTTHEQDLERVYRLQQLKYDPYIMIYDKKNAPQKTRLLARWVNNKRIFRTCEKFEDYDPKKG